MKTFARLVLVSLMLMIAAPVYAQMQAIQIFNCEFNGETEVDDVMAMAATWLKAAKNTKGGENINAYIRFPVAEGKSNEGDFRFVITAPTFAEWGAFTDAYETSAAADVDDEMDNLVDCGESTIWEGMQIK
jgi:hypothetical protein